MQVYDKDSTSDTPMRHGEVDTDDDPETDEDDEVDEYEPEVLDKAVLKGRAKLAGKSTYSIHNVE